MMGQEVAHPREFEPPTSAFGGKADHEYLCKKLLRDWFYKPDHPLPMMLNVKYDLFEEQLRNDISICTIDFICSKDLWCLFL